MKHLAFALKRVTQGNEMQHRPEIPDDQTSTVSFSLSAIEWKKAELGMNESHIHQVDAQFIHSFPCLADILDHTGEVMVYFRRRPEKCCVDIVFSCPDNWYQWQTGEPRDKTEFEVIIQIIRKHPKRPPQDPIFITMTQNDFSRTIFLANLVKQESWELRVWRKR